MVRRKRSGFAFWFLLALLALGAGWAANQEWRWPFPGLFDRDGGADGQAPAPEVVAEPPADEQPATQAPAAEVPKPGREPAAQTAEPHSRAMPSAADSAGPAGQGLVADSPASEQTPPAAGAAADPSEAEVAATEPGETEGPPPQADLETSAPAPEAATSEAAGALPEREPAPDLPADAGAADAAASVASSNDPSGPPAEAGAETGAAPSFDLVRVGRDGRAVIAGRAAPGAEVVVRSGGQVIDRVQATRRGEWVAIPARPLAPGDQELSAAASRDGRTVESDQVVVVAVPGATSPTLASAAGETAAPEEPVAVLLARDGQGTGRVLQAPGRLSAEGTLALMTVSYDHAGEVRLTGEAPPGVPVRIYVDNRPAALVVGDAKGAWSSGLGETLAPGTYTLRLDQLDADGKTVARIETPFTRVSDPPVEGNLQVDYVVVQPGNSLWRIARRLSGKGLDYVHIYGANQTQIRDPDLIYPGQVFEIPTTVGSAG
jgi:nucleoid-associated protein YgaU